jgi:O-acetyl-ADP-ribose deacetylase (regulator of RNase III)
VNPANSKLDHASGVAGAIARAAGPELEDDCDALIAGLPDNRLPTGDAAITRAGGSLQCRWVIHAVGPTWKGGDKGEPAALASCVRKALGLAHEKRLMSISMPAISSGIFGYPKDRCARDIIDAVFAFLNDHPDTSLRTIRLTNVDDGTVEVFKTVLGSEQRPTCSIVRWISGPEDKKQVLRVMHGSPYLLHRCSAGAADGGSAAAAPPPVAIVDFCNLGWELITPYIDDDELRARLQQSLRSTVSAEGLTKADTAADPVRAFAVRDTALTDVRVAIAACASNKFDEASFNRLVQSTQVAIFMAANTQAPVVAVPLLAANTLAFSNTHSARAVIEASRCVLAKRAELGLPALEINLCEGIDSAFFVDAVRSMFVAKATAAGSKDPGASVLAQLAEPAPLAFSAAAAAGASGSDPSSPSGSAPAAPAAPPVDETPKERRARLRAEAEAKLAMRLASENP